MKGGWNVGQKDETEPAYVMLFAEDFRSRYSDSQWDGRSGDRIPARVRFPAPVQTGPGTQPTSYTMDTRSLLRG